MRRIGYQRKVPNHEGCAAEATPPVQQGDKGRYDDIRRLLPRIRRLSTRRRVHITAHDWEDMEFHKWFLTCRSVRFHDDHIESTLAALKTDPFR